MMNCRGGSPGGSGPGFEIRQVPVPELAETRPEPWSALQAAFAPVGANLHTIRRVFYIIPHITKCQKTLFKKNTESQ